MDWAKIKEKALGLKDKAIEKSKELWDMAMEYKDKAVELKDKAIDKTKDLWDKALNLTSETISKTPIALKIFADFEKIKNDKLLVILFTDKNEDESKKLLLQIPLILKNAWVSWATFKTVEFQESVELASHLSVSKVPYIIIYKAWEEVKRTDDLEEIKKFLKDFTL